MEFKIVAKNLQEGVKTTAKYATSRNTTMDILKGMQIETIGNNSLKLTCTNLESTYECELDEVTVTTVGKTVVDAQHLQAILSVVPPDETVRFKLNATKLKAEISFGLSKYELLCQSPELFPEPPDLGNSFKAFELPAVVLRKFVKNISLYAAEESVKPYAIGLWAYIENKKFTLVGTDSYRIGYNSYKFPADSQIEIDGINQSVADLPDDFRMVWGTAKRTLSELARTNFDQDEIIRISVGSNTTRYKFKKAILTTRLLDGEFIQYEKMFNLEQPIKIKCENAEFKQALKGVSILTIMSENRKHVVTTFSIDPDINNGETMEGTIAADTDTDNNFTTKIELAKMPGCVLKDKFKIGFNYAYLRDAVLPIENDELNIYFSTPLSPCVFEGNDGDDEEFAYLLLPLRLNN